MKRVLAMILTLGALCAVLPGCGGAKKQAEWDALFSEETLSNVTVKTTTTYAGQTTVHETRITKDGLCVVTGSADDADPEHRSMYYVDAADNGVEYVWENGKWTAAPQEKTFVSLHTLALTMSGMFFYAEDGAIAVYDKANSTYTVEKSMEGMKYTFRIHVENGRIDSVHVENAAGVSSETKLTDYGTTKIDLPDVG